MEKIKIEFGMSIGQEDYDIAGGRLEIEKEIWKEANEEEKVELVLAWIIDNGMIEVWTKEAA